MATKSFLKDVTIKGRNNSLKLLSALENAKNKKPKPVKFTRSYSTGTKSDIKEIFGSK